MSAASIALEVAEAEGQSVCMAVVPEGSLYRSWLTRKPANSFLKTTLAKSMAYWNHVLWSDESKVRLFDSGGVQHVL